MFQEDTIDTETYYRDLIRVKFRRNKALKTCQNFLKKSKNTYKVENENVIIVFDNTSKIMKIYNAKSKRNNATILWKEQETYQYNYVENMFEEAFDNLCMQFNHNTTYNSVMQYYRPYFKIKERKYTPPQATKDIPTIDLMPNYFDKDPRLNINKATEEEISELPGINIVLAKKIIQYRDLNNGFKSVEELYEKMNIKPHFQKQLNNLVCVKEYKSSKQKIDTVDRIVDF